MPVAWGFIVGAGLRDGEGPADVDDVGVGEVASVGLGEVAGRLDDAGVGAGVAVVVEGDLAEGVPLADGVAGRRSGGGRRDRVLVEGEVEGPAGFEEAVALAVEQPGVEGGDLGVAASVAQLLLGDRPQGFALASRCAGGVGARP